MKTTKTIGLCRTKRDYTEGVTRAATREETALGLALKLHEEVGEVCRAPRDVEEYADVLQALRDFATVNGVSWVAVENVAKMKQADDGSFLQTSVRDVIPKGLLWRAD